MTMVAPDAADDRRAIAALDAAFVRQRDAFASDRSPSIAVRTARLEALVAMMLDHQDAIAAALSEDFGGHPRTASDMIEVMGVVNRARYAIDRLDTWMRDEPRDTDAAVFGSARASVRFQPKGVIGNIVPWNFPFDLSVGPLVEMLAAGNRVVIKPSELAPASADLLSKMVASSFDDDLVHVAIGGRALSEAFANTAWDHLLYTGGPEIGRQVMRAAARNLTPVTLELGGKCPVLMAPGTVDVRNVAAIVGAKLVKNGQMCVSPDHVLVQRDELETLVDLIRAHMASAAPDYALGPDCTGIISARHRDRLGGLIAEAAERQVRVVRLGEDTGSARNDRRMGLYLLIDPPPDIAAMREEIFGPVLPIIPYQDLDHIVQSLGRGDRPLGLYVFAEERLADSILNRTHSGGATVNGCAMQSAVPSLGFGGIGASGMGRHHGYDGFREFSNARGGVVRGDGDLIEMFFPPYGDTGAERVA